MTKTRKKLLGYLQISLGPYGPITEMSNESVA